jgi:transcriptional regulator with XRE-family HTH domain
MTSIAVIVGNNIRKYRNKRGLSQTVLAQLVGYSAADMISRIEMGFPGVSLQKLELIAETLRIPFLKLFGDVKSRSMGDEYAETLKALESLDVHRDVVLAVLDAFVNLESARKRQRGRPRKS